MANFTNETEVRGKMQLQDAAVFPTALINRCIDDAHTEILRVLDPVHDTPSPAAALVLGETLLAGANVMRALASSEAAHLKRIAIGSRRIENSGRFDALRTLADETAAQAWHVLEPFLLPRPPRTAALLTDSVPVLGED